MPQPFQNDDFAGTISCKLNIANHLAFNPPGATSRQTETLTMKLSPALLFVASAAARPDTTTTKPAVHHTAHPAAKPPPPPVPTPGPVLPAAIPKVTGCPKPLYALRYVDTLVGTGAAVTPRKWLTVNYTGYLTDGTKFDSSIGTTRRQAQSPSPSPTAPTRSSPAGTPALKA